MSDGGGSGKAQRLASYSAKIYDMDYIALNGIKNSLEHEIGFYQGVVLDYSCGESPLKEFFTFDKWIRADVESNPSSKDVVIDPETGETGVETESVDLVICTYGLEHIPDPTRAIHEFVRVLKKGGMLFISVPFINRLHEDPVDYHRFTTYYWDLVLDDHFEIKKIKLGNRWLVLFGLWYESHIDELSGKEPSFFQRVVRRIFRLFVLPVLNLTLFRIDVNKAPSVYYHEIVVGVKK